MLLNYLKKNQIVHTTKEIIFPCFYRYQVVSNVLLPPESGPNVTAIKQQKKKKELLIMSLPHSLCLSLSL